MTKLNLRVISQEKELLNTQVDQVTAPASDGQVTILPSHIPLFSKLDPGILRYQTGNKHDSIVVSTGFISVSEDDEVTVIVDSATEARQASQKRAQQAIKAAKESMAAAQSQHELILAEAELKRAMFELQLAQMANKTRA